MHGNDKKKLVVVNYRQVSAYKSRIVN